MKKATAIFSAVICALAVWVITMTYSMRSSIIQYDIGPAAYPRLICYLLVGLSLLLLVLYCILKKEDEPLIFLRRVNLRDIGIVLIFMLALQYVGFPICAFAAIAVMMKIMGCPKTWMMIVFPAAASAVLYLVFRMLLNVRLPLGLLGPTF